ncbi:MAG: FHA domain-containing protein [Acidobacteriota bacterium]
MIEVSLTYPAPEGSQSIKVEGDKFSFGRGSEADCRIADDGLSRLHAVIYREGPRVWIVDQNSTNGTFVNDVAAAPSGTALRSGDRIKIGNHTVLTVHIGEPAAPEVEERPMASAAAEYTAVESAAPAASMLPMILIAVAVVVISLSAVIIGFAVFGRGGTEVVAMSNNRADDPLDVDDRPTPRPKDTATPTSSSTPVPSSKDDLPTNLNAGPQPDVPAGKKYAEMNDAERRQYLEVKAMRIAQVIGNNNSGQIPANAVSAIKSFADAYASRAKVKPLSGCRFGDNLQSTYERASRNAPFIVRAFNEKGIDPRIGLYLAMIESEHCVCLQSPTGPLGMFQFTRATAELHGLKVFAGASTTNPDERCQPEAAARAAASYMKALTGRYGTGPASVPLAIGSYNSGEGGLSTNLETALSTNSGLPRDFWTLIANGDKLSKQFQAENFKYVPKFFAAAIIGENPQDFGLSLQPISTYTK